MLRVDCPGIHEVRHARNQLSKLLLQTVDVWEGYCGEHFLGVL